MRSLKRPKLQVPTDSCYLSFGSMLSGAQLYLICTHTLVLLHKCSFVQILSFYLPRLFRDEGVGICFRRYSLGCIHQFLTGASQLLPLLQSEKSTLPVSVHRWMTVVSSVRSSARRCVSPLLSICSSLCFPSGKQNAVMREGWKGSRLECKSLMRGLMMTSERDLIWVPPSRLYCSCW